MSNGPSRPSRPGETIFKSKVSKVDAFKWEIKDSPGLFQMIDKAMLNIDHEYQRTKVSDARILRIASRWSWVALGTIIVAKRPDGSLWVMDGQHRKMAADKRSDITDLPCMIFDCIQKTTEAEGFLGSNVFRGSVVAYDKFNAELMSGDKISAGIKQMIEDSGYSIRRSAGSPYTVSCIATLKREYAVDREVAIDMWRLCCEIHQGGVITERIVEAFNYLERHLRNLSPPDSLLKKHNREALVRAGASGITHNINSSAAFYSKGGAKVYAEGVIKLLNIKRRANRIASIRLD